MAIVFCSTRALSGWESGSLIPHLKILETCSRAPILLSVNTTERTARLLADSIGLDVEQTLHSARRYFARRGRYSSWWDVYEDIDVGALKRFEAFYLIGGLDLWRSHLTRTSKRAGVFPHDRGQLKFQSTALHLINVLMLLKAHHAFGVPLHEMALDPNEMAVGLFHESIAPRSNYYQYHGYDMKTYQMRRLDSLQYFLKSQPTPKPVEKSLEFVFGYTALKNSGRDKFHDDVRTLAKRFEARKRKVLVNQHDGKNTIVPKTQYLRLLARSRYTFVLPAYDQSCFSIYRFIEALHLDCLPLLHPDCRIVDVERSFGVDLSALMKVPRSEKARLEHLNYLKKKMLPFRKGFAA